MTTIQIENLFLFIVILSLHNKNRYIDHSPDYILEKWKNLVRVNLTNTQSGKWSESMYSSYVEYVGKWGIDKVNTIPSELLMFITAVNYDFIYNVSSTNVISGNFKVVTDNYKKYIGTVNDIYNSNHGRNAHPLYIEFVLNRIIPEIPKQDIRDINISSILS